MAILTNPHDHDEPTAESEHIDALLREFGYTDDLVIEDVVIDEVWDA